MAGGLLVDSRPVSAPARRYAPDLLALAAAHGISPDELPLVVNGCSGGLSRLYALAGRDISCVDCCDRHDLLYQLGGSARDRKAADRELRACAAAAGSFPPGWRGYVRRLWRGFRAWGMYAVVRVCGRWYWVGS